MIGIETNAPTSSATVVPALDIQSAVFRTSTCALALTLKNPNGVVSTKIVYGQEGADLYHALVQIQAATLTTNSS